MQTIAIFRPQAQLDASRKLVEARGYRTIATSLVEIVPVLDERWRAFTEELRNGVIDYVVLTSANGVRCCIARGLSVSDVPALTRVIAIGPSTQQALLNAGFTVNAMPQEFSSKGLVKLLENVAHSNIWLLRSAYGSSALVKELRRREAILNEVTMYTLTNQCGLTQQNAIRDIVNDNVAAVLFTSAMTVQGFFSCASHLYDRDIVMHALQTRIIGAIGGPTDKALKRCGVSVDVVPARATFADLVASIHRMIVDRRVI